MTWPVMSCLSYLTRFSTLYTWAIRSRNTILLGVEPFCDFSNKLDPELTHDYTQWFADTINVSPARAWVGALFYSISVIE